MKENLCYDMVPKAYEDNLLWRRFIWEMGVQDKTHAATIWEACKRDPLFYINSFVWTHDPRAISEGRQPTLPFITYEYQDVAIKEIVAAIDGQYDILIEKSRDLGATWCVLMAFDYKWRFFNELNFHCLSKKEEDVDKTGAPKSLFWKLDYLEERLPPFLAVRGNKHDAVHGLSNLHIENYTTRSVIDGESANPNALRSGRATAVLRDEEAHEEHGFAINKAVGNATRCQIRLSTPNGLGNSFHAARHSGIKVLTFHWTQHPLQRRGLYRISSEGLEVIDKEWHEQNPGYEFKQEPGGWDGYRSPYYDEKEIVIGSKLGLAQELDVDYLGSGAPFFESQLLTTHRITYCSPPVWTGAASDLLNRAIDDKALNPMSLWFHTLPNGKPPQDDTYILAADISTGTGASDSAINITSTIRREKVGKYISNQISPESFADLMVALGKWLTTPLGLPYMIWDQGGPGLAFGQRIVEKLGWSFCYYHMKRGDKKAKKSSTPGYPGTSKLELFTNYRAGLADGEYTNRSETGLSELEQYVYSSNGSVEHVKAQHNEDMSGNKQNHGDEAYSDALAFAALLFMPEPPKPKAEVPVGCWEYRRKRFHEQDKAVAVGPFGEHWE